MPIYEFKCPDCDHSFEELAEFGKMPPCPECGCAKTNQKIALFTRPRPGPPVVPAPQSQAAGSDSPGPVGFHFGPRAKGVKMIGCTNHGGRVGMEIEQGAEVESHGFRSTGADVGIDNAGKLVDTDTTIT